MRNTQRLIYIFATVAMFLSACTQSLSGTPAAKKTTPTVNPNATNVFVSPLPAGTNPMAVIEEFAKQTAVAQTAAAGGVVTTPQAVATTQSAPVAGITATPGVSAIPAGVTPTNAAAGGANPTPVPSGTRPTTYTLQAGEFPYCIARRFNVDPDQLLSLSGLTSPDVYYAGLVLKIPQSGAFPGSRALLAHPATYSVLSGDETLYSVACKFGDVDPAAIASANGISVSADLTAGQQIKIP
jgi:LysM repeat protein